MSPKLAASEVLDNLLGSFELMSFRQAILNQAEMSVRLHLTADSSDSMKSKFGGAPDLPGDFAWPVSTTGKELAFMAQFAMADLAGTCASSIAGGDGTLSFFYEADEQPWGFDPKDRGGWKVFHFDQASKLVRREFPATLPEHCVFKSCSITLEDELTLPDSEELAQFKMSPDEEARYFDMCAELYGEEPVHRLLGHAQLVQSDWKLECQLASHGVYVGDSAGYESEAAQLLEAGAQKWKLLLQVDSDDMVGMSWGDAGRIYFCIDEDSLSTASFAKVWTILQCY